MVKRYMTLSQVSVVLIQSIVSNISLLESHTRPKDSLEGDCIKQRCNRGKTSMLDLLHNDHDFFYIDFCLTGIVMYLIDCYSIADVV